MGTWPFLLCPQSHPLLSSPKTFQASELCSCQGQLLFIMDAVLLAKVRGGRHQEQTVLLRNVCVEDTLKQTNDKIIVLRVLLFLERERKVGL